VAAVSATTTVIREVLSWIEDLGLILHKHSFLNKREEVAGVGLGYDKMIAVDNSAASS
jgi:hypothetical protein